MTILELRMLIEEVEILEEGIVNAENYGREILSYMNGCLRYGHFHHESMARGISLEDAKRRVEHINFLLVD